MKYVKIKRQIEYIILSVVLILTVMGRSMFVLAAEDEYMQLAEERKELPIQTDQIANWPAGPKIGAESAMLVEINSGTVLYSKNIDMKEYPASVTKMLTALVALDNSNLDDMVVFSEEAVGSIDWREDANIGISAGDSITMEECLYGLLVGSANEVAYAIAEHISEPGNLEGFAKLMNEYAKKLGCTNSNFVTPNGIHDENHYTTAHDLSLIATEFFSNELLCKMSSTTTYQIPKSDTQPRDDMIVYAKSKLHPGREYGYEDLVGTKTGYTDIARQTLVSCAERGKMKLVCVIMKEEAPYQFTDTIQLFDFGFDNFQEINISDNDTKYSIKSLNFLSSSSDFFGSSKPILQINNNDCVIIPLGERFENLTSEIGYEGLRKGELARIRYFYNGAFVGYASVEPASDTAPVFDFGETDGDIEVQNDTEKVVVINITMIIVIIIGVSLILVLVFLLKNRYGGIFKRRRKSYKRYENRRNLKIDRKRLK